MAYRSIIDGQSGEAFIARALETNGPLTNIQTFPPEVITAYAPTIPAILLDVWDNYGIGDLSDGKLRLCLPGDLQPAVDHLFEGDPYLGGDTQAIAYGAFGDLILWNTRHQMVYVNMQLSSVEAPALFYPALAGPPDRVVLDNLLNRHPNTMDAYDNTGAPMYDAARDIHGDLEPLHIYGMHPPAPFHEEFTLDRHRPADVLEWLSDKIANSRFNLDDTTGRRLAVREIGPLPEGERPREPGEL